MFTLVPMATAPPSPERLELGPGVFWLRFESFSLPCLPRARSDFTERGARSADVGGAGERKRVKRQEEGRRGGTKNPGVGRHWVGGAKSQEHYIIAGAKSKREGYESVY